MICQVNVSIQTAKEKVECICFGNGLFFKISLGQRAICASIICICFCNAAFCNAYVISHVCIVARPAVHTAASYINMVGVLHVALEASWVHTHQPECMGVC